MGEAMIERFLRNQRVRGLSERTIERRSWTLSMWARHVGGDLATATTDDVEGFLAGYTDAQTRYSLRSDVNQFYRYLVRRGLVAANPVDGIDSPRLPKRAPSPVSPDDVRRLLRSTDGQTRLAIMLAAYAGLRVGEIAALRGEHVDLERCVLVVRSGKGAKDATVAIAAELAAELALWPRTGRLFTTTTGAGVADRIRAAYRRLGIEARPHDLRHTFGTETTRVCGGNMRLVQRLMRHESLATTQRYVDWWPEGHGVVDGLYDGDTA